MRVLIDSQEKYPVYSIITEPDAYYSEKRFEREAYEVPDELVERYLRVNAEWLAVQNEIEALEDNR
jgi:hypothetical protein